ncbi:unnamed protein product [Rangifer tarandus platyrhynchus]|uniref:Uncharacterized protein n=2 Tax=Rangifer tarandus platyrhynchus TaxID=3082113 RepID=A0ACB0F3H0_RANTA|nr:unnamed protein product [Rangifer tarandus platyrhynchus]CAI9707642.1 unnamed protein product [Rangifer tarandus platyrhynchus]
MLPDLSRPKASRRRMLPGLQGGQRAGAWLGGGVQHSRRTASPASRAQESELHPEREEAAPALEAEREPALVCICAEMARAEAVGSRAGAFRGLAEAERLIESLVPQSAPGELVGARGAGRRQGELVSAGGTGRRRGGLRAWCPRTCQRQGSWSAPGELVSAGVG